MADEGGWGEMPYQSLFAEPKDDGSEGFRGERIDWLFYKIEFCTSAVEYAKICAELVREVTGLSPREIAKLADAIERGFQKRGRGRPRNHERQRDLAYRVRLSPRYGGLRDIPRADAVRTIANDNRLTEEAAAKAYDLARNEARKIEAARARRKEKKDDLIF